MNYNPFKNIAFNAPAYGMAVLSLLPLAAGCAKKPVVLPSTSYDASKVVPEPTPKKEPVQKPVNLEAMCNIAGRALGESAIQIPKDKYPLEYGAVLRAILSQYQDNDSKVHAEKEGNMIALFPTACGYYQASVVRNVDGSGKPTGKNLIYQDKREVEQDSKKVTKKVPRFPIKESELPEKVREWLINIQKPSSKLDGKDIQISADLFDTSYDTQFARLVERIGWQAFDERWHKKRAA